jgi:hypothetical protein
MSILRIYDAQAELLAAILDVQTVEDCLDILNAYAFGQNMGVPRPLDNCIVKELEKRLEVLENAN